MSEQDWGDAAAPTEGRGGRVFGINIAAVARELAGDAVRQSVKKMIKDAVKDVVEAAVEEALDPSVIEELHSQAAEAAQQAVDDELAQLEESDDAEPQLYFGSVDEFVRDYLVTAYRRRVDGQRTLWAADWWNYDEAVIRLEALWRSWEALRLDPATGMSVWWRDHADHHMNVLLSSDGPFAAVGEGADRVNTNEKGQPLPYEAPPAGMFPDLRDQPARERH